MSGYQKGVITKAKTKSEKRDYGNSSGQKRPKTKKKQNKKEEEGQENQIMK